MKLAWRLARLLLAAYAGAILLMLFLEHSLIFVPMKYPQGYWNHSANVEDAWFTADDGTRLHGWFSESKTPSAVILFCHGNAGNITHRLDILAKLTDELQASVLMFDYRGYGRSAGVPSERGVLQDARAARANAS